MLNLKATLNITDTLGDVSRLDRGFYEIADSNTASRPSWSEMAYFTCLPCVTVLVFIPHFIYRAELMFSKRLYGKGIRALHSIPLRYGTVFARA